jgi:hypothetical protein
MCAGGVSDRCRVCWPHRCAPARPVCIDLDTDSCTGICTHDRIHGRTAIEHDDRFNQHRGANDVHHNGCSRSIVNRATDDHVTHNRRADHQPTCSIDDRRGDDSTPEDNNSPDHGAAILLAGRCAEGRYDIETRGVQLRRRIRRWSHDGDS